MPKLKEKIKKEWKELSCLDKIFFFASLALGAFLIWGDNIELKLSLGGIFLLLDSFRVKDKNRFSAIFEGISGIMALLTIFLPRQPLLYLVIFYSLVLLMLFGFLYTHRKIRNIQLKENTKKLWHLSYIFIFLVFGMLVIVMMKSVISFGFQIPLAVTDYIFIIQLTLISIITFFLLSENIILLIPIRIRENLIGKKYSTAYALFAGLCLTMLIGGYFYINADSAILQKILIVLGAAFFTSLLIAESLKSLFK